MTSWRAHYAAALYATGVPPALIALALGDFVRPVSHQRVYQLLDKAGLEWRQRHDRIGNAEIDAAIRAAQAAGLVRRCEIIAFVRARARPIRLNEDRISARITQLTGASSNTRYISPPGTPPGWIYCHRCATFAPPSGRSGFCRAHYNAYMRESGARRRRAAGVYKVGARAEVAARARKAAAAVRSGEAASISEASRRYRVARNTVRCYLEAL